MCSYTFWSPSRGSVESVLTNIGAFFQPPVKLFGKIGGAYISDGIKCLKGSLLETRETDQSLHRREGKGHRYRSKNISDVLAKKGGYANKHTYIDTLAMSHSNDP